MEEIWKSIPGYEGLYEVSSHGDVRRIFTKTRLSAEDEKEILQAKAAGISARKLAKIYGMAKTSIQTIGKERRYTKRTPHLITRHTNHHGYHYVNLCKDGKARHYYVHKIVTLAFIGERPIGLGINHKNGVKTDNRIENLEYCTQRENLLHAYRILKRPSFSLSGSSNGFSKLTEPDIPLIYQMRSKGMSLKAIGNHFHVAPNTICDVLHKRRWGHVIHD